jgi:hypothetical protein
MDTPDRTASEVPFAAPEQVVDAVDRWFAQVVALAAGPLTSAQATDLADRAMPWLQLLCRTDDADHHDNETERLLSVARDLLDLRDRTSTETFDGVHRVLTLDAELCEALRYQTLLVLEFGHDPFEGLRDLAPIDLLIVAATFRDAFAVLDAVGWLPSAQRSVPVQVPITSRHLAQLERRRDDVLASLLDRLDSQEDLTDPGDIAEADAALGFDRQAARGLVRLLQAARQAA